MEKYGKAWQATDDNIISACALYVGYEGYRQTPVVLNADFFVVSD